MRAVLSLTLSHFRSHKALSLESGGAPVALYGPNGVGKTNVLEAISLLSPGRGLRRAQADDLARRPEGIGWRVTAGIATPGGAREVRTGAEVGARRSVEIDGKQAAQSALATVAPVIWLTPAMDGLWTGGASDRRRFIDRATLSFEPGHAEAALTYEKAMRDRNRLLRDGRADPTWLTALEAQMARAGAAVARARAETVARLTAAQAEAETAFPRADIALEGMAEARFAEALSGGAVPPAVEAEVTAALTRAYAEGRRDDAFAGRTLAGPHRTELTAIYAAKAAPARSASTGEQKALLISLVLASARALAARDGAPPILLLDEVAAHLDPARRRALFAEIEALGAQAWMTGAEAALFAEAPAQMRRVEVVAD